jgi:hypothetical protein
MAGTEPAPEIPTMSTSTSTLLDHLPRTADCQFPNAGLCVLCAGFHDALEPAPAAPAPDAATTTQCVPWREVPLYWLGAERALTDAERVTALAEYRATGGMVDIVMCDPSDYGSEPEEADAMCFEGPSVDEIDWAGFEAVTP